MKKVACSVVTEMNYLCFQYDWHWIHRGHVSLTEMLGSDMQKCIDFTSCGCLPVISPVICFKHELGY